MEEEEYKAFLEREVSEDLHNLITVDTSTAVGAPEHVEDVEHDDKKDEGKKKKKGERKREKAMQKLDKKSKEEADHEFLMK